MSNTSEFYVINSNNTNLSSALIIKVNALSPTKYFFNKETVITFPRLLDFEINSQITKKQCHYHNNFDSSTFIYFKNFDLNSKNKFLIPSFLCEKFKCLSCGKIYDKSSGKCCDLINSPIEIIKAKLIKITIPNIDKINQSIYENRLEFLTNHFPDLTDMLMIKR